MKILCNRQPNNFDRFVGRDFWVKVEFPLDYRERRVPHREGYAKFLSPRQAEFVFDDTDTCYYFRFISDNVIGEDRQYHTSHYLFDIMTDEYCIEKDNIAMVQPPEIFTSEEFIDYSRDAFTEDDE